MVRDGIDSSDILAELPLWPSCHLTATAGTSYSWEIQSLYSDIYVGSWGAFQML